MKSNPTKAKPRAYAQVMRAQSAEETGQRIAGAFLTRLMAHWLDEITLEQVAADAGVTVMTVVRRFGGKEGLLAAAVKLLAGEIDARRQGDASDLTALVGGLMKDYEQAGDAVLRLLALEPRHASLKTFLDFGRGEHRRWVTTAFNAQLGALEVAARERAVDMLVIATDVYAWKLLRRDRKRSVAQTHETIKQMLQGIMRDAAAAAASAR